MGKQHVYTSSAHTQIAKEGGQGQEKEGGEMFFLTEGYHYSLALSLSVLTSRRRPTLNSTPDMNHDPFHFLHPLEGDPPLTHPFTHTPEIPPSTPGVFSTCRLVCERVRGLCPPGEWERTHFLCQIASHIPHSPSIRLVRAIFSSFLLPLSFSVSLWGALSAVGGTKHWFIPRVKHDPQEHNAFSA